MMERVAASIQKIGVSAFCALVALAFVTSIRTLSVTAQAALSCTL
jgi:hypothetical protein